MFGVLLRSVLLALLKEPDGPVHSQALYTLERLDPPRREEVPALVRALRDEDPVVRDNAWHAIGASGPLTPSESARWLRFRDARAR